MVVSTAPKSGGSVEGISPLEGAGSKGRLLPACAALSRAQSNKEMKLTRPVQIAALQLISRVRQLLEGGAQPRLSKKSKPQGRFTPRACRRHLA
jgi:hypothetical protein